MDISFIILTWNSEKYIKKCIDRLVSCLENTGLKYEIFVIDNGSDDNTTQALEKLLQQLGDKLKLYCLDKNMGTTVSRNLGIKNSKGRYLCIMDSDVEVLDGTIVQLIDNFENGPDDLGLVVPRILYPNGNLQKSTDMFPTLTRKIYRYFFLKNIEFRENKSSDAVKKKYVEYAISAVWLVKRDVIDKIGLLDEKIFYSPEDVDFCIRTWKGGYKILYDNSVSVIHHTQEISRGFKINKAFISHIKGLIYYFIKHRYLFKAPKLMKDIESL